ncbi:MAG: glucose-1-phosphate adenylyltransferase [Oscillospiraceae bacterium]|nr:glucose-1-phosphate adenylyltransferase [Oscillospiraceae bacterium]MDD4367463.1 glucose-1-phosphate adenylyltransferase [Oscillospiraceae bacterium]
MNLKKELIAMILAGGQGSRLGALTDTMAKPAVPYGSRYRIIDFPLSNCVNSGIDTVGVLTQYQPLALNTYVGNGHPWDLDRNNGGAFILPPYQHSKGSDWYKNTANAIYQNIPFIDNFDPDYVLILSGDHIYKMNYAKLLEYHIAKGADATIAVYEVSKEEARRFGIMTSDENGRIVKFEEKPAKPESTQASMGIYMFNWPLLKKELAEDEADVTSSHDFGKNVIPKLLAEDRQVFSYPFQGYWKDVGTIESLWESNMDIIDRPRDIDLQDDNWRIYSRNPVKPAHYIAPGAKVRSSALTDGCLIYGSVHHSILSHSVVVEAGAVVEDSVLMPGVVVRRGACLKKVIVGMETIIGENDLIGGEENKEHPYYNKKICSDNITLINGGLILKPDITVPGNCMVSMAQDVAEADQVIERCENIPAV